MKDALVNAILFHIEENLPRIVQCLNHLSEEQIWSTNNAHTNSIGNLVLHLSGNITQYVIAGLGGQPDNRKRALEFSQSKSHNRSALIELISQTIKEASQVIHSISEQQLVKNYRIQGFTLTGARVLVHVTEHLSYHTGQIALLTKQMIDKDLKFYGDQNLDELNSDA